MLEPQVCFAARSDNLVEFYSLDEDHQVAVVWRIACAARVLLTVLRVQR